METSTQKSAAPTRKNEHQLVFATLIVRVANTIAMINANTGQSIIRLRASTSFLSADYLWREMTNPIFGNCQSQTLLKP